MIQYVYDGSFGGFLTSVFESFERKEFMVQLQAEHHFEPGFFEEMRRIYSDSVKAQRVYYGLEKCIGKTSAKDFFSVFLSEDLRAIQYAFDIIQQIFTGHKNILDNYGDERVLYFSKILKKVSRERHRMKAFIRFEKSLDGMYFAVIAPDFNVLPLVINFFKNRYADQLWLIFDEKRHYGMYYDKLSVSEVQLTPIEAGTLIKDTETMKLDVQEAKYQQLWQSYFKSTYIEARRNMPLHIRHIPKRYWRYLTEKW